MGSSKIDILKGVAYTAISQMMAVEKGWSTYDQAKSVVDHWVHNRGHDVHEYFKENNYRTSGDTPEWVGQELATEAWEALEYFKII